LVMERLILAGILIISFVIAWRFIPAEKARDAFILFLSIQFFSWPIGLFVVEMKWIEYPVQLFPNDNNDYRSSLYFEFFLFPITAILFNLYYPSSRRVTPKLFYYLLIAAFFTCIEFILERFTKLVDYHKWQWYWSYFSVMLILYLSHKYYKWFKRGLR